MKKTIIFALTLLLLMGCRHHRAVSPRLVELDSLIAVAPDSAAALLQAIPSDSLFDNESRAYHALLLTQAKYKAYFPFGAKALDTINMAVRHYSDGHDLEKNTRSYLYKGCVFEDQQRLDSAMYYYKAAEDLATQSGDTFQRGYILTRMASLFRDNYANREAIGLLDEALNCFQLTNDSIWQLNATLSLASQYQTTNLDSAFLYVNQALSLSKSLDSLRYDDCLCTLASCHLLHRDYRSCVSVASESVRQATNREAYFKSCHWAAQAYAMMGMKDSGEYFLGLATPPYGMTDSVLYLRSKALLSANPNQYKVQSSNIADTLVNTDMIVMLNQIVKQYNYQKELSVARHKHYHTSFLLCSAIFTTLAVSLVVYWRKRSQQKNLSDTIEHEKKRIKLLENDLMESDGKIESNVLAISQLNIELANQKVLNKSLETNIGDKEQMISTQMGQIVELSEVVAEKDKEIQEYESLVVELNHLIEKRDDLLSRTEQEIAELKKSMFLSQGNTVFSLAQSSEQTKRVMSIVKDMKQGADIYYQTLLKQDIRGELVAEKIRNYINAGYMSKLRNLIDAAFPKLALLMEGYECGTDEADIVYLHYAGFTNELICSYLNLTNKKTISNKKRIIATKVLGKPASIEQLVE